jgi:hypothetical protein
MHELHRPMTEDDPEDRLPQGLQSILSDCDCAIRDVLAPFTLATEAEPTPDTIYHYTDDKGLMGILRDGTLWLTDIFSLNDPSELKHGIGIASDLIRELGRDDEVLPHVRALRSMGLEREIGWNFIRGLTLRLALGCVNASVFFKHPAYRNECEYRFLQLHTFDDKLAAMKFRQRPYRLVR